MASQKQIKAGGAYVELTTRNSKFNKGLRAASRRLKNFGRSVTMAGRRLGLATAAMALPIGLAVGRFVEFDDKMRQVRAVTQAAEGDFAMLTKTAKELGRTTSFTAVEVADLMTNLGRAGFKPDQINAMTGAVLNLARATGTEAADAAGIMSATLRQFGLSASDAGSVADDLTTAANKSFNTVDSLGESLSYAGPIAKRFNMSLDETLAILGVLGNVGIQGSQAGTALRRLLLTTGAEADKLEKIFKVKFKTAAGDARPLIDVLAEVQEKTKDLGTADRAKKFRDAFKLLGVTAAGALSDSVVSARDLLEALRQNKDAAKAAAEEMDNGLGGVWRRLVSAVEGFRIAIGESLEKELRAVGEQITFVTGVLTKFVERHAKATVIVLGLVVALGVLSIALIVTGLLVSSIGTLLGALAAGFSLIMTAVSAVSGVVTALFSPWILALVAVIALLGGLAAWWLYASGVAGKSVDFMWAKVAGLVGLFKRVFAGIATALKEGQVELAVEILWLGIKVAWLKGLQSLEDAWMGFKNSLVDAWMNLRFDLLKIALDMWGAMAKQGYQFLAEMMRASLDFLIAWEEFKRDFLGDETAKFRIQAYEFARAGVNLGVKHKKAQVDKANDVAKAALDAIRDIEQAKRDRDRAKQDGSNDAAIDAAEKKLAAAIKRANQIAFFNKVFGFQRNGKPGGGEDGAVPPDGSGLPGTGEVASAVKGRVGVSGTFNASIAGRLAAGGSVQQQIAENTRKTAKGVDKLNGKGAGSFG